MKNTSLAAPGHSLTACNAVPPAKSKMAGGPKMADGVQSYVIGRSDQLSLNKFFDPSTPSMRKVRDGEEKMVEKIIMTEILATNVIASQPPYPTYTATPLVPI